MHFEKWGKLSEFSRGIRSKRDDDFGLFSFKKAVKLKTI